MIQLEICLVLINLFCVQYLSINESHYSMHALPELPYAYNALEPAIDAQTMELHHSKHHATYVQKLNDALRGHDELQQLNIFQLMGAIETVPEDIRMVVRNNGGGHANHSLFWTMMTPGEGGEPIGELLEALQATFGSFDTFKSEFTAAALTVFGSGWGWLVKDGEELKIISTRLQDNPLMNNQEPVLGLDVWEHAYYLKYQNKRPDYIEAWWSVVNWPEVARRFKGSL